MTAQARQVLDRATTEAEFGHCVARLARLHGWLAYHTHDSRRSERGFPDWVFVRGSRVVFVELKTVRGRLSPEQERWLDALRDAGQEVHVWRPSDWTEIEGVLGR